MPEPFFYSQIFFTNIRRILDERQMTQKQLSDKAGISRTFISNLANGQANPSLRTMEAIAKALETDLVELLALTDLDRHYLEELTGGRKSRNLPVGFEHISATLTSYQAFLVKEWDEAARRTIISQKKDKPAS